MKRKGLFFTGILLVVLIAGFFGYRAFARNQSNAQADLQTTTVQRGSLAATLSSVGNTRSGQSATLVWQTSGKVQSVTLKPGDTVTENQLLAELDPTTLSNDVILAKQNLIDAEQALDDLVNSKTTQAQALQAVVDAQQNLNDAKQKYADDLSQAQLTLANDQQALKDAQNNRTKMNYPHTTDELVIERAQTEYLQAKQAYKDALKEYNKYDQKNLTNPERALALNRLLTAEQTMNDKLAIYNWYTLGYTQNDISQADAELAVAQANLEKAQVDYDALKNDTGEAAVALADAQLEDAQRSYERVKNGPSQEDIDAAQAAVDAAQATLDRARLTAPFAGTITEVDLKSGDLVSSGDTAFRIDDLSGIYVDLEISEVDLASLKIGQPATLQFDAIADKQYTGEVTDIGMIGSVSQGVVNYPVTVRVTNPDQDIRPGMTASVDIVTDQISDSLLVPNQAIRTTVGQKTVTILFEGQQISVPVTVDLFNSTTSAVTSDQLREGDTVVLNTSTSSTTSSSNGLRIERGVGGGFGGPFPGGGAP